MWEDLPKSGVGCFSAACWTHMALVDFTLWGMYINTNTIAEAK
jgi:hypothetical protein